MASMMFILQGSVMTMNATWNGPPGQMVRINVQNENLKELMV